MMTSKNSAKKSKPKRSGRLFVDAMLVSGEHDAADMGISFYRVASISPDGKTVSAQVIGADILRRISGRGYSGGEWVPDESRISSSTIKGKIHSDSLGLDYVAFGSGKSRVNAWPWNGKPVTKYDHF